MTENIIRKSLLSTRNYVVFRKMFGQRNKDSAESFLSNVFGKKIKIISYMDNFEILPQADDITNMLGITVELENGDKSDIFVKFTDEISYNKI